MKSHPTQLVNARQTTVSFDSATLERIDRYRKTVGLSRSAAIRMIINAALKE